MIRLRAQAEQFILSCPNLEVFLEWLEVLSAAIDLAPSLEERSLPQHRTLPRARRRLAAGELQQHEQQPRQEERGRSSTRQADQESISSHGDVAAAAMMDIPSTLQPNSKWAPRKAVTREANMRYARRCTVALLANAPRRSNYVVVGGCRYKINWDKKKLVQDDGGAEAATGKGTRGADSTTTDGSRPTPSNLPGYAESTGNRQRDSAVVTAPRGARAAEDPALCDWWWIVGGI